jgi:hypothetical protein
LWAGPLWSAPRGDSACRYIPVVVITEPRSRADRKRRAIELGARVVENDFRFEDARINAGIQGARAIILATSSDSANLECALDARREYPQLRIVMRLDSEKLAGRLCSDFGIDAVLSPPVLAAPEFARAALRDAPTSSVLPSTVKRHPQIASARQANRGLSPWTDGVSLVYCFWRSVCSLCQLSWYFIPA